MCHDPDWGELHDEGATIDAKLTTHDAGNKVTLLDFTMAEHMNREATIIQKRINIVDMIPYDVEPEYWKYGKYALFFAVGTYLWFIGFQ